MIRLAALLSFLFSFYTMHAQTPDSSWLRRLLEENASPALKSVLAQPDTFRYQLIYTRIDRDKNNKPSFTHYYLNVDKDRYFNPASTVKMPLAFLSLEKLNRLKKAGVGKYTTMLTDSAAPPQTTVLTDTSAKNGLPSIAQYIRKIFLVSDNDAYNRLYEFLGQQYINETLQKKGYRNTRITRRFVRMNEEENRLTNPVRFLDEKGKLLYAQPAAKSAFNFDFSQRNLIGRAYYDRDEKLIGEPMDFTTHNNAPLADLQRLLQSVLFPSSVPAKQRFDLTEDDYQFLYRYMSELPSESHFPNYDTTEFFDSYTKFFFFRAGKEKIPSYIRSFNKTGWSYGFLTDVCYIVDFKNNVEFMLSGNIYVNKDGVLNDNKYEYDETGYPFFKEVGNIIYNHELKRPRKHQPDLQSWKFTYD
ncbi:serine hydrolase [Terrimonas ferruginea]|uniref:serine hydrolase n=1 Tax=Terrimonas ferruginea TaxID=249 RepID=UPI00041C0EF8|nr:serine hydrolase [Terrimonas ferruginea]